MAEDLYTSMLARQKALQETGTDPGNPDLYGSSQLTGTPSGAPPAPVGGMAGTTPGGPITTQAQVAGTQARVGGGTEIGQSTTPAQSFQQALINRLNPQAVTTSSPSIAPAITANNLSEQRMLEQNRNNLAERAVATGTNMSGGMETGFEGLNQDRAQRQSQYEGNLVQHANELQNQDQTSAMAMVGQLLGGQASLSQQKELAQMDAALREKGLSIQQALGMGDLELRRYGIDQQKLLGLLGLQQQGSQFQQGLAQQGAQFSTGLDSSTLLSILSGLG